MTLRRRFLIFLAVLHLVFAGCAVWFLWNIPVWLVAVEIFFVISFAMGLRLLRSYFGPLELIRSGAHYLREGEFSTRITPIGQADMDQLVDVYNRMVDTLREERTRGEEQEHLLQKLIAESPNGVVALDVDGDVAAINPAAEALLNTTAAEILGRPLSDLGTPFALRLAELKRDESCLLSAHGRHRVRCQAATFMDRGFARRFLLLDELTEELHRSEKYAYEKLIRMMSHEVNNTSGAVQSLLQSCLAYKRALPEQDREDFARALDVAIQRTANLDEFMRGFATVVRLPAPQRQLSDPWEIASQVGLLFRERFETAGIVWRSDLAPNLARVNCDPVQMEQVLMNVVKNAVESLETSGEPREILLRGSKRAGRYFLSIADTGPGLAPEAQTQIFTPFYTTRENGQGIGLTMVQEILLAHGFDFMLENRDSRGAEFTIVF